MKKKVSRQRSKESSQVIPIQVRVQVPHEKEKNKNSVVAWHGDDRSFDDSLVQKSFLVWGDLEREKKKMSPK
jgi:hypothetical protein